MAALGACTKGKVAGSYAGLATMSYAYDGVVTIVVGRATFYSGGAIILTNIKEGYAGEHVTLNARGKYTLRTNCVGAANLTLRDGDVVIGTAKLDLVVAGTQAAPLIMALYSNANDGVTGQLVMQKIAL